MRTATVRVGPPRVRMSPAPCGQPGEGDAMSWWHWLPRRGDGAAPHGGKTEPELAEGKLAQQLREVVQPVPQFPAG